MSLLELYQKYPQLLGGLIIATAISVILAILGIIGFTFEQAITITLLTLTVGGYLAFHIAINRKPKKVIKEEEE